MMLSMNSFLIWFLNYVAWIIGLEKIRGMNIKIRGLK